MPLEERDPNTLSLEESRELVRRMREREANNAIRVKQEVKREKRDRTAVEDSDPDTDDRVIEELRPSKRTRASRDSGIELVDLTEE